jgi:hypothetical protein
VKTFFDSGVLLIAHKGREKDAAAALTLLDDKRRRLYTSDIVRLELLPKAYYFKQTQEVEFYEAIFSSAAGCQPLNEKLVSDAMRLAKANGLAAADALNIAAAITLGCEEFITTELPTKAMFRTRQIRVLTLHAAAAK